MDQRTWPDDWDERRRGRGCPKCLHGRAEEDESGGVRFFAGQFADGYLQKRGPQPGYTIVAFHRRHVADLTEFSDVESTGFWHDVVTVAKALNEVFTPCHMNTTCSVTGCRTSMPTSSPVTSTTRVQECPSRHGWFET